MNKILVAVSVILLVGCGGNESSEMAKSMKQLQDDCRGTLTVEVQYGAFFGTHLKITCLEDVSDEAREKKKAKETK